MASDRYSKSAYRKTESSGWALRGSTSQARLRRNELVCFFRRHPKSTGMEGLGESRHFNINNINKRLDNLMAWISKAEPDVVWCVIPEFRCHFHLN